MKKIIIISLLIINLISCTTSKNIYIKSKPFAFKKTEEVKKRNIRIYSEDAELYRAYIDRLRNVIKFHNSQIDEYSKSYEK